MISRTIRQRDIENDREEARFEQDMFINNPEMYKVYKQGKEDNAENEGAVWLVPESIEEARALETLIQKSLEEDRKNNPSEEYSLEEYEKIARQMNLSTSFDGIDIDQIGDE